MSLLRSVCSMALSFCAILLVLNLQIGNHEGEALASRNGKLESFDWLRQVSKTEFPTLSLRRSKWGLVRPQKGDASLLEAVEQTRLRVSKNTEAKVGTRSISYACKNGPFHGRLVYLEKQP